MPTRIIMAITATALAAASALFIATPGAIATQGQPVLAGSQNTETYETLIVNPAWGVSLADCLASDGPTYPYGLVACGLDGIVGRGWSAGVTGEGTRSASGIGVFGRGSEFGVKGYPSRTGGTGVFGGTTGSTGIGVWGQTAGTGSAVYGQATANGLGVNGVSAGGTGVQGQSDATNGTGLKGNAVNGGYAKGVWGVSNDGYGGFFEAPGSVGYGVYASGGEFGVKALGGPTGVYGSGTSNGVEGDIGAGGTAGVYGHASGPAGYGVAGSGPTGVLAAGSGIGVDAGSANGIGVKAASANGTALQVNGKAKFSRSNIVTVPAGSASTTVTLAGVTTASMVVATAQQNGNVFVKAAVPAGGSFKIFLNGNAPAGGLKVAYFVLN